MKPQFGRKFVFFSSILSKSNVVVFCFFIHGLSKARLCFKLKTLPAKILPCFLQGWADAFFFLQYWKDYFHRIEWLVYLHVHLYLVKWCMYVGISDVLSWWWIVFKFSMVNIGNLYHTYMYIYTWAVINIMVGWVGILLTPHLPSSTMHMECHWWVLIIAHIDPIRNQVPTSDTPGRRSQAREEEFEMSKGLASRWEPFKLKEVG